MDINNVGGAALSYATAPGTRSGDTTAVLNLKKAMDVQAQNAAALIQSVVESAPPPPDPESRLGQNLDVSA